MRYQLIVFDWDGTLMDSEACIVTCMQQAAREVGVAVPGHDAAKDVIGLGLAEAVQRLFAKEAPEQWPALVAAYRRHFLGGELAPSPLFAGVREVISDLAASGLFLAVATGKSRRGLDRVLDESGLGDLFTITRCADETFSKPHPQMLLDIMDHVGLDPQQTLMIGDTEYDVQMAANAGVDALGVSYGVHQPDRLRAHGALHCLDAIDELPGWLSRSSVMTG